MLRTFQMPLVSTFFGFTFFLLFPLVLFLFLILTEDSFIGYFHVFSNTFSFLIIGRLDGLEIHIGTLKQMGCMISNFGRIFWEDQMILVYICQLCSCLLSVYVPVYTALLFLPIILHIIVSYGLNVSNLLNLKITILRQAYYRSFISIL